jgi:hypothetical protein
MTESIKIGVQERQLPLTGLDSIATEKPDWLTQLETVLEVLNEGVVTYCPRLRAHCFACPTRISEV